MKKLLTILLICAFANLTFAYTPTNSEIKLLNQVKPEIIKIYNKDVNKAYSVKNNINSFLDKYKKKESAIYVLNFINNVTLEYIKDYESKLKAEQEKEKEETIKYQNIDDIITSQNDKLFVLNNNNTKTIASFEIEPKYDHLYLQNVYLENIGNVSDISNIFQELYLVDRQNRVVSNGYVNNNYLVFDIGTKYLLKQDKIQDLYVKAILRQPTNQNQIGELKFQLANPTTAQTGTQNGIKATSYSNGNFITIDNISNVNPIVTLVTYNDIAIVKDSKFESSYSQALGFRVYNNSNKRLELKNFVFNVGGSFLDTAGSNTKFILKVKGTNQVFGEQTLASISGNNLTISHSGDAYKELSANTFTDYILEIEHSSSPTGSREIKLYNLIVGDGFGGTITDLNNYSNIGVPSDISYYRY